ncbi:uncharacterized protein B0H64DRAFT_410870 [Chaetomium fimeti]|uniref:Uncharacterized protein n=1 Tax=Chaetomium fimeti TaxID=1854472 RepID=A0AAE0LN13_9PEZI|nr:hypothetical protein B0H64DRAFT_410870 [Chaetomium fimeti]
MSFLQSALHANSQPRTLIAAGDMSPVPSLSQPITIFHHSAPPISWGRSTGGSVHDAAEVMPDALSQRPLGRVEIAHHSQEPMHPAADHDSIVILLFGRWAFGNTVTRPEAAHAGGIFSVTNSDRGEGVWMIVENGTGPRAGRVTPMGSLTLARRGRGDFSLSQLLTWAISLQSVPPASRHSQFFYWKHHDTVKLPLLMTTAIAFRPLVTRPWLERVYPIAVVSETGEGKKPMLPSQKSRMQLTVPVSGSPLKIEEFAASLFFHHGPGGILESDTRQSGKGLKSNLPLWGSPMVLAPMRSARHSGEAVCSFWPVSRIPDSTLEFHLLSQQPTPVPSNTKEAQRAMDKKGISHGHARFHC